MNGPKVGDVVRVPVTGTVIDIDTEMGTTSVRGNVPGMDHIEWTWKFHWATEFDVIKAHESHPWQKPEPGDVYISADHVYFRDHRQWISAKGETFTDQSMQSCFVAGLEYGGARPATYLRGGKPVQS